jgi:hypothetical protein
MSIVNCPHLLIVVASVSSNLSVWPAWQNYFVCKEWAKRIDTTVSIRNLVYTSSFNSVIVCVPQSDCSILWACYKFIGYSTHIINVNYRLSMIFGQQHLRKITHSDSVEESLIGCSQYLNSISTRYKTLDASIELRLHQRLTKVLINVE